LKAFNVLKDSVRGIKDKKEWESKRRTKEADFFSLLD
jgi:hypothetical protein